MFRTIYKRELLVTSRNLKMPAFIIANNSILAFVAMFAYYLAFSSRAKQGSMVNGIQMLNIFSLLSLIEFVMVIILTLVLTVPCIINERKDHTLDLIMIANTSPIQYVLAKVYSRVMISMTIVLASSPILGIVFYIGGISLLNMITMFLLFFVATVFAGAIGVFFSCYCKRITTATISSYLVMFLVALGSIMFVGSIVLMKKADLGIELSDTESLISIGKVTYILLVNPLYTFLKLMHDCFGTMNEVSKYVITYEKNAIFSNQWIWNSCLIQIGLSMILILLSVNRLKIDKKNNKRVIL